MRADICKMIGIKVPIFQGAMTNVSDKYLVSAVSNAGGLGIFAPGDDSSSGDADWLRMKIQEIRERTDKPFGVNLAMRSSRINDFVKVICEEKVAIITTGGGDPTPFIPQLKEAGVLVAPVVPDARAAKKMEEAGADMVVASGMEGGGFVGKVTTLVTVPQVIAAVNIPVIAAGGICDGRGLAAAMALGASGVQMGTRFMMSKESTIPQAFKDAMVKAKSKEALPVDSVLRKGPQLRCLKTKVVDEIQIYENQNTADADVYQNMFNSARDESLMREGRVNETLMPMGEAAGAITQILSCQEIIDRTMAEYRETLAILKELA